MTTTKTSALRKECEEERGRERERKKKESERAMAKKREKIACVKRKNNTIMIMRMHS